MTLLKELTEAWRLRRVLIIGGEDIMTRYATTLLSVLGARVKTLPADANAQTLSRALAEGRTGAVLISAAHDLTPDGDLFDVLHTLSLLFVEMREAGVPLAILLSHADVYAPDAQLLYADEYTPLGGKTREGLIQAIAQLYADGVSRGLLGDPVPTIIGRHAPCLGSDHPATAQYSAWCRALLRGEAPIIEHPDAQGTFLHPLDVLLGALSLGALHWQGTPAAGIYTLGVTPHNLCANRSAWLRLSTQEGGERAFRSAYPPRTPPCTPLDGTRVRALCGYCPQLNAIAALTFLMAHERASAIGEEAAQMERIRQAEALLTGKAPSPHCEAIKGV